MDTFLAIGFVAGVSGLILWWAMNVPDEKWEQTMKIKIKCTNVYDDETIENIQEVDVPSPFGYFTSDDQVAEDLDEWAQEELFQFTGTGRTKPRDYAGYFVEVLECEERPELIGLEVESYG